MTTGAKGVWGNGATGKLSDVAGSFLLAVVLTCGVATAKSLWEGIPAKVTVQSALWCATVVVAGVALVKTSTVGADVGALLLGVFRWPLDAVAVFLSSGALPCIRLVDVVVDPTDAVAALVAFGVAVLVPQQGNKIPRPRSTTSTGTPKKTGEAVHV